MSDRRQFLKQAALLGVSPWLHEKADPVQQAALHSDLESDAKAPTGAIVLENQELRLVIAGDATAQSLIHNPTGQECLAVNRNSPMFTLTQYRPYDNELQQTYPAITTHFPGTKIRREGNKLNVSFDLVDYEAIIGFTIMQSYIAFRLEQLIYTGDTSLRPKLQTPIDEAVFVQLPVRNRENIGRWLNVVWDQGVAVNLLATDASTRIDAQPRDGYHLLRAGGVDEIKLEGLGAALIVTTPEELLDRIAVVENDFDLPRGVESRRRPEFKYSYYQMLRGTPETIDRHLSFAKLAGLRTLYVYYRAFAKTCGHFPWKPEYPNGMQDLKAVVQKINQANILPGIHIHYNKADKEDAYVTGGPDPRLNLTLRFTLGRALDATSTTITVLENPRRCTLDNKRRILKIDNELISYEQYTTTPPYQFLNCKRGILESQSSSYPVGMQVGQLDVDTLPVFVRFTQDTDIQQEVADRLAAIYRDAGFKFVYFDGAEDVPGPHYWYTVSRPQWIVYKGLNPKPLFAEGACKSHFSWHILTRGNAFDNFRPEVQKAAVRAYPATAAPMSAKDFTPVNFGWIRYWAPGKDTIGTQPDILEYTSSRAAAWDCPVSLVGNLDALEAHPRTPDNLEVIRRWEDVRIEGWLTREQKAQLRKLQQEHTLLIDENTRFELVPCDQITNVAAADQPGRAFVLERQRDIYVMFWHTSGEAVMRLPLPVKRVVWMKDLGKPLRLSGDAKSVKLPFADRRYLRCIGISRPEVITAFQNAKII